MARRLVIGIDLGGTKISGGIGNLEGEIFHVVERPTDKSSAKAVIDQVVCLTRELALSNPVGELSAIGIGVPGITVSETGFVVWAPNLPDWRDVPLGEILQKEFGVPVLVENDVDVAVLGEWWKGAGQGAQNVFLMAVGTGIGGGILINGRLYKGSGGVAGAVGWFVIGEDRLFKEEYRAGGSAEILAAGPGIGRRGQEAAKNKKTKMTELAGGLIDKIDSRIVFEAARLGDPVAKEVVDDTAKYLGIVAANVISLLNPEVLIIGGGVADAGDIILKPVAEIAKEHAQPFAAKQVRIEKALLGNRAGLIGALCLAAQSVSNL
ncbi:MAG: ROK family protein [Armatimonadota bacterium]|nr:ROK family protein [Armatimonadota bacterium]